jgi:hypothetical protein
MVMNTYSTVRRIPIGKDKISKFYFQQNQESSLLVIFPDEGYSSDRPLLYYARKVALLEGHDVICISYKRQLTWRDMGLCSIDLEADLVIDIVKKCLSKVYKNIYFISKGIGTEVAGVVSDRLGYEKIKSIFITPTNYAAKHIINSKGLVVIGTNDDIFTQNSIDKIQECKNVEVISVKDADRYLEDSQDINKTLETLGEMISIYTSFLKSNYKSSY